MYRIINDILWLVEMCVPALNIEESHFVVGFMNVGQSGAQYAKFL